MVTTHTMNGSKVLIMISKIIILSHFTKMMRKYLKINITIVMSQISKFSKTRRRKVKVDAKKLKQIVTNIQKDRIIHNKKSNTRNRQTSNI